MVVLHPHVSKATTLAIALSDRVGRGSDHGGFLYRSALWASINKVYYLYLHAKIET